MDLFDDKAERDDRSEETLPSDVEKGSRVSDNEDRDPNDSSEEEEEEDEEELEKV
jgi:hypothetical protein